MLLYVDTRAINEMHVVDFYSACRHARETGKAIVEMAYRISLRTTTGFEHFTYKIDAPARRLVLIARKNVSWTGVGAKPIVHTRLKDRIRLT